MLKIYIYPEIQDQLKDAAGKILFAVQDANTYKPLSFSKEGNNSAIASFTAVKTDSKGAEISRTSLSTSIITVDSTNNVYTVDGSVIYASLLDECIYYFEFQNDSELYQSEFFQVQVESIFLTADNIYFTADNIVKTADMIKFNL